MPKFKKSDYMLMIEQLIILGIVLINIPNTNDLQFIATINLALVHGYIRIRKN